MARAVKTRAASAGPVFNPPIGRMPVLQFMTPAELAIDPAYQRSIEGEESQRLIRAIAQEWNWDLCQPLVVARREDGGHYVLDGQHRLEAARMRGDIAHLPCVVGQFDGAAGEAATFVSLNAKRRPLCKVDIFKAAVASGDGEAAAIAGIIEKAGLTVAPHLTAAGWKPGMIGNIGGIEQAVRKHGLHVAGEALECLSAGFAGEVLQYAGTIYPGIAAVCAAECPKDAPFPAARFAMFTALLGKTGQRQLRRHIVMKATEKGFSRTDAAVFVVRRLWETGKLEVAPARELVAVAPAPRAVERPVAPALPSAPGGLDKYDLRAKAGARWCGQCEALRTPDQVAGCTSRFCKLGFAG